MQPADSSKKVQGCQQNPTPPDSSKQWNNKFFFCFFLQEKTQVLAQPFNSTSKTTAS